MNITPKTITLIAHRHQDRHGNTYHFVAVSIDGVRRHVSPIYYGYGRQYEDTAFDWLVDEGIIPVPTASMPWTVNRWCQDNDVKIDSRVSDHHGDASPLRRLRYDAIAICRPFAGGWSTLWSDGIYTMQCRAVDYVMHSHFIQYRVVKDGKASCHTDYPVMYDDGTVAYDRPESISQRMQTRVRSTMRRMEGAA